jgi:hypothetical protein
MSQCAPSTTIIIFKKIKNKTSGRRLKKKKPLLESSACDKERYLGNSNQM